MKTCSYTFNHSSYQGEVHRELWHHLSIIAHWIHIDFSGFLWHSRESLTQTCILILMCHWLLTSLTSGTHLSLDSRATVTCLVCWLSVRVPSRVKKCIWDMKCSLVYYRGLLFWDMLSSFLCFPAVLPFSLCQINTGYWQRGLVWSLSW